MTAFSVLEGELDPEQLAAATDPAREVLTLACAGSGKSRTLAYRIAWLLADKKIEPEEIVAFTFTEKAADSIKLRLADAIKKCSLDPNVIGRIYIGTIHSYCFNLLKGIDARYRQFSVLDQNRLKLYLVANYAALQIKNVRREHNNPPYFITINKVADAWAIMNDEGVLPAEVVDEDPELGDLLDVLGTKMANDQFIDFSLMQRRAVEAIHASPSGVSDVAPRLRHLLVDEYQDVNSVQDELIQLLHRNLDSLFVVGDDDQSIYGWRGADVTQIQKFGSNYPNTSQHTLATNYRSTPLIVRSSDHFAHEELGATRIAKNPTSKMSNPPEVPSEMRVLWFEDRAHEADWVVDKIHQLLGKQYIEMDGVSSRGLTPADFAILMRSTRTNEPNGGPPRHTAFTKRLDQKAIQYSLEAGGGLFERPHVEALRSTYEMFRGGQPSRDKARRQFEQHIEPWFPEADFEQFASVVTKWGRLIHTPLVPGMARRRIRPQQLLFDLLEAFHVESANLSDAVLHDIGVFSRIMQDVETVYPSVDTTARFENILNFLSNIAENGYDTGSNGIVQRPNAVTVSTVHQAKGLEFPVVFVVDVENMRFPGKRRQYNGFLPENSIQQAIDRGAYRTMQEDEARLFYTALTRAERFLYVTGCADVPGGKISLKPSIFSAHLDDQEILRDPHVETEGLQKEHQRRRIEDSNLRTSFSDLRYYLRCPKDYQYRRVFGFGPAIPDLFGFGLTIHTGVGRLHEQFPSGPPSPDATRQLAEDTFHLKHVMPSNDPENHPGPYEKARDRMVEILTDYVDKFGSDFEQRRQIEASFEIPSQEAVISGSIDLMIQEQDGQVTDACVIDFKALNSRGSSGSSNDVAWDEVSLQIQLYALAARDILLEPIERGYIHFLKDGMRIGIPLDEDAIRDALENIKWAISSIIEERFPMRPEREKCGSCDFRQICPMQPEELIGHPPPSLHVPRDGGTDRKAVGAVSQFDDSFSRAKLPPTG